MKTITLLLSMFIGILQLNAQISHFEDFENYTNISQVGWTTNGFFFDSFSRPCDGTSIRDNLANISTTGELISPNFVGQSDGTDIRISFDYKLINWGFLNATQPGWGNISIQFSTNNGNSWNDIASIDDSNHQPSVQCATKIYIVDGALVPEGSNFMVRLFIAWESGDFFVYMDNISITQNRQIIVIDDVNSAETITHCYDNRDNTCWVLDSVDGSPLNINFNQGTIENCCDTITIYDGEDDNAPIIYQGNNDGDLAGLQFAGTAGKMFIKIDSNEAVSCSTAEGTQWNFSVNKTLSVSDNNLNSFTFYPNPTKERIEFRANQSVDNISIYSILGKKVTTANVNLSNNNIDVSSLASGAYLMKVSIGSVTKNYKFIKL